MRRTCARDCGLGRVSVGRRDHLALHVSATCAAILVLLIAPVRAGEVLTRENLWVKRPGTGAIPAEQFDSVLGCIARRDLPADTHLGRDDFA